MSLLYWLPMTDGIVKNQGLSAASPTTSGAVSSNNNGKLGKCVQLGANSGEIIIPHQDLLSYSGPFSVSFWINIISNPTQWATVFGITGTSASWSQEFICFQRNGDDSTYSFVVANGSSSTNNHFLTDALTLNTWYHFTLIQDSDKKMYIYQNGDLLRDYSTTITPNFTQIQNFKIGKSHTGYQGNFLINDFRFYTNALSPLEVKRLAQGLVLHYPLNRGGFGGENIISGTSPNEIQYTYPSSGYSDKFHSITTIVPTASQYTLSFWAKSTVNGDKVTSHYYSPNTTTTCVSNQGISRTTSDGNMIFTLSTDWEYYWVTYTQTETTAVKHVIFPRIAAVNNQYSLACIGSGTISVKCVKFEEGSVPTPWIPNQADALYSQMGLDNNIEYDVSGYGNNGTRNGTFSWSGDTPRYNTSAVFSGNQYIVEPNEIITTDSTIALWIKSSLNGNAFVLDARNNSGIGKQPIYQYTNGSIQTGGNARYVTSNPGLLVANTWVHVVLVQNGDSLLIYKNGDLFQTISCANSPVIKPTLGARYTFSGGYTGQLSDVRIYTTALSADDVMALYKNAGYVDSDGNVYAYEMTE